MGEEKSNAKMKLLENWKLMGVLAMITIGVLTTVFLLCELPSYRTHPPPLPLADPEATSSERDVGEKPDPCLEYYGGIEVDYVRGSTTAFTFDLCSVIDCGKDQTSWRGYEVWTCHDIRFTNACLIGKPTATGYTPCEEWDMVTGYTLPGWDTRGRWEGFAIQRDFSNTQNPLTMSIGGWQVTPQRYRKEDKVFYLVLGVDVFGKDPRGIIKINFKDPSCKLPSHNATLSCNLSSSDTASTKVPPSVSKVTKMDYTKWKPRQLMSRATGYVDSNLWLDWLIETTKEQKVSDCVACATARPRLFIEPAPLYPEDPWGFDCMLRLTRRAVNSGKCAPLSALFPPIDNNTIPGPFTPRKANYTCFNFTADDPGEQEYDAGEIPADWCEATFPGRGEAARAGATVVGTWARAGLYYYCGGGSLHVRIPNEAVGVCAMVRLGAPLLIIGGKDNSERVEGHARRPPRRRRQGWPKGSSWSFDLTVNSPTYIDSIGVPRGVPNEFKLVDQIAAGFENIPVLSALFPVTPNKNVDRINYVHYNVLRLSNLTRDAIQGLAEQVGPTSLMAVQNRMALDMVLAEKGGVCEMFGQMCCTFIPNNTAPDGSVTRALEGLRTLAHNMHEHSGIDNPLEEWMTSVFGQWKGFVMSILVSLSVFTAVLTTCGCCLIPCLRALVVRLIDRAVTSGPEGRGVMMPLLKDDPEEWRDVDLVTLECVL
ncbi:uncharacterized protein LOC105941227 isoform X1 [Maylandia zebra]|uniref:uncharacterized protein LOC105941227 isoform X1 n=1 Tax=Maylandia zebra TaxID=106582 RepID=UPI00403C6E76